MELFLVAACIQFQFLKAAVTTTDNTEVDFFPPFFPKLKNNFNYDEDPLPVHLPNAADHCKCISVPKKWTLCYGQDSCKTFPRNFAADTPILRVRGTQIQQFMIGDFTGDLNTLEIEDNPFLSQFEGGAFRSLTNLTNLTISYNTNLRKLANDTFQGLTKLKQLFLIKNGFTSVRDVSLALNPVVLPSLLVLSLSENAFHSIQQTDFTPMSGTAVNELSLVLCQIQDIHPSSLLPFQYLSNLRLGQNTINPTIIVDLLRETTRNKIPLKVLSLYNAGFRKTPPRPLLKAISKSNITQLVLAKNQFELIDTTTFPPMPVLKYIDLREVLLQNISYRAFGGMPKLHTLLLSGNKLQSVPDGALVQQLTYLDLSQNSGNSFFPSYFSIGKNKFLKMKNLKVLELSFNHMTSLFSDTFQGLKKLQVLGLKNATLFHIEEGSFTGLQELLVLNLENNPFGKNGLTPGLFAGLDHLQVLLLGGCFITYVSTSDQFGNLTSLTHLGLERNRILVLPSQILQGLIHLESLELSQNYLVSWEEDLLESNTNLTKLNLGGNQISHFTEAMLRDFAKLSYLDVSDNPFTCDCATKNAGKVLGLLKVKPGMCVYPNNGVSILQYVEKSANCTSSTLLYVLPTVAIALTFLLLGILVFFYRSHIRYWAFLLRLNLNKRDKSTHGVKTYSNYQYDAFVSYSNEDRSFVVRLVTMLENFEPFLKLCVYERDFEIGAVISETVLENVAKSRKTVLVISDSYVRSQWCRWELQIAQHHGIFFDNSREQAEDCLVMIKLGDVTEAHMTPTLKYLLNTRVYLQWDAEPASQKAFWEKLRKVLTPPKIIFDSSV